MEDARREQIVSELSALGQGDFAQILMRAFARRADDLDQVQFLSKYVLALAHGSPPGPGRPDDWEIEFVAFPTAQRVEGDLLSEQGLCSTCGFEAVAEAKQAACGICGTSIELT